MARYDGLAASLPPAVRAAIAAARAADETPKHAAPPGQHVAIVVKDGLTIYLNGQEVAKAAGAVPDLSGGAVIGKGFKGEIDELQVSTTARSADWFKTAAQSQGQDQKLVVYGPAEGDGEGETGHKTKI